MPTLAGEAEGPDGEPSEPQAREAVAVNGHASPARPASPASSAADSLDDVDLSTPPRPGKQCQPVILAVRVHSSREARPAHLGAPLRISVP